MKIYLREITDQETVLDFTEEENWVAEAVEAADEQLEEQPRAGTPPSRKRSIQTQLTLRRVDDVVVVNGSLNTHVQLVCSRCAAYFSFACNPAFSALFCKDPVMAGVAHIATDKNGTPAPMGRNKGKARHAHEEESEWKSNESGQDIDITYISEDFINLADVLTEQIQLQIPFQPLCREECRGICPQCGADQNQGRCACAKLVKGSAFSVLRDFKVD